MFHTARFCAGALMALTALCAQATSLRTEQHIYLWGDATAPGSAGVSLVENVIDTANNPNDPQRDVTGVIKPALVAFPPKNPNGISVIVIPGGGYTKLVYDKEGVEIARWLNSIGVTAFVLKHRLPGEGHAQPQDVPLQDVQRAVRLLRKHADEWGLRGDRIGVMGFSAGGHLAAAAATMFDKKFHASDEPIDQLSARPDFAATVYGVMSVNVGIPLEKLPKPVVAHQPDKHVTEKTPPIFMATADDDIRVDPGTNLDFYRALRKAGQRVELHIFREGAHGFAIRKTAGRPVAQWTQLYQAWMNSIFVPPAVASR